jgi:ubiquinone biosynthesis monooxygenase Coq7
MPMRHFTPVDHIIKRFDKTFFALSSQYRSERQHAVPDKSEVLTEDERKQSLSLMRINHTGEICAQSLYLGQALVARQNDLVNKLFEAANEEQTHLQWCRDRIETLQGRTSFLNPLFAVGSMGIGIIAGLAGDKWSLGFLAETEHQVVKHIDDHLAKISEKDVQSREILEKMREDELRHKTNALKEGGRILPNAICILMKITSKIMTFTTRYI